MHQIDGYFLFFEVVMRLSGDILTGLAFNLIIATIFLSSHQNVYRSFSWHFVLHAAGGAASSTSR